MTAAGSAGGGALAPPAPLRNDERAAMGGGFFQTPAGLVMAAFTAAPQQPAARCGPAATGRQPRDSEPARAH